MNCSNGLHIKPPHHWTSSLHHLSPCQGIHIVSFHFHRYCIHRMTSIPVALISDRLAKDLLACQPEKTPQLYQSENEG